MTETLAAFLAMLALFALTVAGERTSIYSVGLAGACAALAVLCRPTFLPWVVVLATGLGWAKTSEVAKRLRMSLCFALAAALVLAPWAVRNQVQFGRPILTTTHAVTRCSWETTLLLRASPLGALGTAWPADELNRSWLEEMSRSGPVDETRADRTAYAEAWHNIRRERRCSAYACLARIGRFWSPIPQQTDPGEAGCTVGLGILSAHGIWLNVAGAGRAGILVRGANRRHWLPVILLVGVSSPFTRSTGPTCGCGPR